MNKKPIDLSALDRFNPYMTYEMTTNVFKELLLRFGAPYFYNGRTWEIKSKSLGAGVRHVWCEESK